MSRANDVKIAFKNHECSTCKYCDMVGFDFYCSKKGDKRISAMAVEPCYEVDENLKRRLLYFAKKEDNRGTN